MNYLAVLGRQPEISIAELEATGFCTEIDRLGGTMKLAVELGVKPLEYLLELPEGKITVGVSDYSRGASRKTASNEALKLKKILTRQGRSVRVVENHEAMLSTATSLHNGLNGRNERKVDIFAPFSNARLMSSSVFIPPPKSTIRLVADVISLSTSVLTTCFDFAPSRSTTCSRLNPKASNSLATSAGLSL